MISAIDQAYGTSTPGSVGAALGKSREDKMAERAEALRQGQQAANSGVTDAKLRGVAEEFVSVFMNQVMKSMRATVQENPDMHGDNGEKFFQDMLDTEYSKTMARGSGYGLTDLVYQALAGKARLNTASAADAAEPEAGVEAVGL